MGRFFGPQPNIISGDGFFLGSALAPAGPTFMVVGANNSNPNISNVPHAAWRDASGTWHVINATALGARGILGVTHVSGQWYATTNAPGALDALIGVAADPPSTFAGVVTGVPDHLGDITYDSLFVIASLFGNIITAPLDLSAFTSQPSHGPGSYVVQGVRGNGAATSYVCVGTGSTPTGICQSTDAATWTNQIANFSTETDAQVISNTIIWDGTQFVAVGGGQCATSPNGLDPWTLVPINTTTGNCICFDAVNGLYYVGDQAGNTLSAGDVAGLNLVAPVASGSSGSLRCVATAGGLTIFGDNQGACFSTPDGTNFTTENPGLGAAVLNSLSANT